MTMVGKLLQERGKTATARPPDGPALNTNPQENRIPRFGEIVEQMEHDGATQSPNNQSSNVYQGNHTNQNDRGTANSPNESSLS